MSNVDTLPHSAALERRPADQECCLLPAAQPEASVVDHKALVLARQLLQHDVHRLVARVPQHQLPYSAATELHPLKTHFGCLSKRSEKEEGDLLCSGQLGGPQRLLLFIWRSTPYLN